MKRGLVKKPIIDKRGRRTSVWVRADKPVKKPNGDELRVEYEKVKDIRAKVFESGIAESGRTWSKTERSPKVGVITRKFRRDLSSTKELEFDIQNEYDKGKTVYISVRAIKYPMKTIEIRVGDHLGRGGVYTPDFDVRTWEHADEAIKYLKGEYLETGKSAKIEDDKREKLADNLVKQGLEYRNSNRTYLSLDEIKEKNPDAKMIQQVDDGRGAYVYHWIGKHYNRGKRNVSIGGGLIRNGIPSKYYKFIKDKL